MSELCADLFRQASSSRETAHDSADFHYEKVKIDSVFSARPVG